MDLFPKPFFYTKNLDILYEDKILGNSELCKILYFF